MMATLNQIVDLGVVKVQKTFTQKVVLGFLAGAMVAFSYAAYIRVAHSIEGGMGVVMGALIFPVGLLTILVTGGELITGNMMIVGTAWLHGKVTTKQTLKNWLDVTLGNLLGAIFVAYFFGIVSGILNESMATVHMLSRHKIDCSPIQVLILGIGCNWFVGVAIWMFKGAEDSITRFMGMYVPIVVFALIGFQHSVANMFLLAVSYFEGQVTLVEYATNISFAYLGNIVGGIIFVGGLYSVASRSIKTLS